MPARLKHFFIFIVFLLAISYQLSAISYAAPCYGTRMPERNKFFAMLESYSLFKRPLEGNNGTMRSQQEFYGMSYGVFDWLSIDLKAGAGNIKQHPVDSNEVSYNSNFAGGYGLRLRIFEMDKIKAVFGFQHISVHPKSRNLGDVKNKAILDDWQVSLLGSYDFKIITPYLGTRWSRVDYIHKWGSDKKRVMSPSGKEFGFIYGCNINFTDRIWLNLEGQAIDATAFAGSINYSF